MACRLGQLESSVVEDSNFQICITMIGFRGLCVEFLELCVIIDALLLESLEVSLHQRFFGYNRWPTLFISCFGHRSEKDGHRGGQRTVDCIKFRNP